jgi:hypothetical protein
MFWLLGTGTLVLSSCGSGDAATDESAAGSELRQLMYQIDFAQHEIGTNIRNAGFFPRHAELLVAVAEWVDEPAWEDWVTRKGFDGDPARFLGMQDELRQAAADTRSAAEAEDLDALREGFIRMYSSCIACHKRYQPSY